jgi:UDP-N-acetylglucosamine--N-acetylmuramyl-(pentapeptide) pyrophosphoryl-undecaprenol N-acetylglucosamine transferase
MRQRPATDVLFVGSSAGFEARWFPRSGFRYKLFEMHGLRGHRFVDRLKALAEFARALGQSMSLLSEFGPALVVSAGGYASAPVAVAAIVRRVPLVLLEQNTRPGLANRILWRFARKICVGFDETASFFNAKAEVTGNPLRVTHKPVHPQPVDNSLQILVLGGSTGAHRLNIGILDAFKKIDKTVIKLAVVHQTGDADEGLVRDTYRQIGLEAQVTAFIDDVGAALDRANLVVARAGAMTVTDIVNAARPAIFVPYPFHRDQQQVHNAEVVERLGGAIVVRDDQDLGRNLQLTLEKLIRDRGRLEEMGQRAYRAAKPDASARIARLCFEIAESGGRRIAA